MVYGFYYLDRDVSYLQVGLESEEQAKKGLKNIADAFCGKGKLGSGGVDEIINGNIKTLETYNILYEKQGVANLTN